MQESRKDTNSADRPSRRTLVGGVTLLFIVSLSVVYYFTPFVPQQLKYGAHQLRYDGSLQSSHAGLDVDKRRSQLISVLLPRDSVLVETNYGRLLGYAVREQGKQVNAFLGIPYAKPPIGSLRFRKPRQAPSWSGLRDASRYSAQCVQYKPNRTYTPWISDEDNMSEDCLYLNVWQPTGAHDTPLKPVMVWFHGGAFFSGSTDLPLYDGRTLAAVGDVVVVTVNYRLGAIGFLDLKTASASGNQGLYDQLMALKWVNENIRYFGGNSEEVTIFGQSAGAISVGLHYLSPLSQPYFKRGILESGAPTVSRLFFERDSESTNKVPELSRRLGCHSGTEPIEGARAEAVLECLRHVSIEDIMSAQRTLIDDMSLAFGPISGDEFLPDLPVNLLHDGELSENHKEVLIGVNRDEGSFFLHFLEPTVYGRMPHNLTYDEAIQLARRSFSFLPDKFAQLVFDMFLSWAKGREPDTVRAALSAFIGDSTFTCPATLFAELLDHNEMQVYFYLFDHRVSHSPWPNWMGVIHFDEVPFVFGHPVRHPGLYQPHEVTLSRQIMNAWVTFAKTG